MKLELKIGTTSKRIGISIADASSNVGAGLAGLLYNSTGLTWYYWREDEGNAGATQVTLATATRGTWATGGFIEKDATNLPGEYEIGIPDAALASGAKWVKMLLKGAANMVPVPIEIQLVAYNPDSATDLGLSTLTGNVPQTGDGYARVGAAGAGLTALGDTRIANLDATISSRTKPADTQARVTLVDTLTTYTGNTPQTGDSFARIGALGAGLTAVASQASLSALITTVGIAGAGLTAADDAILTAIAALNNLSQANIRSALGLASANLDTQLDALPTNAELATALGTADDAVLAAIAALNNLAAGAAMTLTAGERLAIADAARARQLTEPATYPAIGVAPTLQEILFMIHGLLADFVFTGTTQSIKRLDAPATEAMSFEIDSETAATEHVRVG